MFIIIFSALGGLGTIILFFIKTYRLEKLKAIEDEKIKKKASALKKAEKAANNRKNQSANPESADFQDKAPSQSD